MAAVLHTFPPLFVASHQGESTSKVGNHSLVGSSSHMLNQSARSGSNLPKFGSIVWSEFFSSEKLQSQKEKKMFKQPSIINGRKVVSSSYVDYTTYIKKCEDLVIGSFVGKRPPFMLVENVVSCLWKLKNDFSITIHGESSFVFDFETEEDRIVVLEQGYLYIDSQLFIIIPWHKDLEKEMEELKIVPVWVNLRKLPLYMWNETGLGNITSCVGTPIMLDKQTLNISRMSYARICVDVDANCDFPSTIPVYMDGELSFEVIVDYPWKPPMCAMCETFNHPALKCKTVAAQAQMEKEAQAVKNKLDKGDG
ncbi:uncharacterized protein LOC113351615 [Papaver somniferum]|uniref:uncharacterized protein LOC113351615 n=1 Tax=Papaver somniferum TaxID=3469 RepID=UPI000E6F94F9|nr:uncharacterized protein LOC113351615 [Papaver somniferum]